MKLTGADIAEITRLLDESHFSNLKLEMGDFKLRIRRGGSAPMGDDLEDASPAPAPAPAPAARTALAAAASAPPASTASAAAPGEVDVPAPLLGNFYHAPRPGEEPFVQTGDKVTPESVIGIIEVMKLMNSVRAGVAGTVVAVLAQDGKAIEEGQPLIRVKTGG